MIYFMRKSGTKSAAAASCLAVFFALCTYLIFYLLRMPLARNETVFIAFGWAGIVFLVRWFLGRDRESATGKNRLNTKQSSRKAGSKTATPILVLVSAAMTVVHSASAQSPIASPRPSGVACSVDYPEISTNTSVHLFAYVDPPNNAADIVWNVTGGTLKPSLEGMTWDFHGVSPGLYRAEAKIHSKSAEQAVCVLEVVALELVRSSELVSGHAFLVPGVSEPGGYSLYSYLLLGSRPDKSTQGKYLRTIEALLQYVYAANDLENYFQRSELNLTAIPVIGKPPANVTANWVLANYDFVRARALLARLTGTKTDGPYIVSTTEPLTKSVSPYLFEDLSVVPDEPPQLLSWWIREFVNQSAQRTAWDGAKLELFALRIRTTIAILAKAAPAIHNGVSKWISFVK
jgi:hypothetical protein